MLQFSEQDPTIPPLPGVNRHNIFVDNEDQQLKIINSEGAIVAFGDLKFQEEAGTSVTPSGTIHVVINGVSYYLLVSTTLDA